MWKKNPKPGCEYFFVLPISADVFQGCQDGNSIYESEFLHPFKNPKKSDSRLQCIPQKISAN